MNELSWFFGAAIGGVVAVDAVSPRQRSDWRRALAALVGLVVVVSTRKLVWMVVGFEVVSLATLTMSRATLSSSLVAFAGLVLVAVSNGTTDLALVELTTAVAVGIGVAMTGLVWKWLQTHVVDRAVFVGAGIAIVAVFVRLEGWVPDLATRISPLMDVASAAGLVVGGVGAALSRTPKALSRWVTVMVIALAVAGVAGGAPALPHVLMHLTASALALALVSTDDSAIVRWLALLSLASFPPFPGFVTKIGLLSSLGPAMLTVALAGSCLVAIGCARSLGGSEVGETKRPWAVAAAVVMTVLFGLYPGPLYGIATRAASGLF